MLTNGTCNTSLWVQSEIGSIYVSQSETCKCKVDYYYFRSNKMVRPESVLFGAVILSVQTQYPTCDSDLLVILESLVNWHYYLHTNKNFAVHIHHGSWEYILIQPRLTAWQIEHKATLHNVMTASSTSQVQIPRWLTHWWQVQTSGRNVVEPPGIDLLRW